MSIPWDENHRPTVKEVGDFLVKRVYDVTRDEYNLREITQAVLRGLSDVIYQQRRNFPEESYGNYNYFYELANASADVLFEEIGDAL